MARRGFSLIELLVVLALVGVSIGGIGLMFANTPESLSVEERFEQQLTELLLQAQATARQQDRPVPLRYDSKEVSIVAVLGEGKVPLPLGWQIVAAVRDTAETVVYPSGMVQSAAFAFRTPARKAYYAYFYPLRAEVVLYAAE
ncbi:prepilin-type N-terminal cleavage/methylation domain-containing protein [Chrysiogenes arsenatis]|uniref:prepilin-type N-terminal cleavage/methylation domain-containing protein n=1 Tax=Chrysiogenes arsenatis TaxID=309797 RepID=UPI00040F216B|nr:prepilin-type N-terminal cleavage/methylation domain-containing protein [Chrysiogenes arsenatis]